MATMARMTGEDDDNRKGDDSEDNGNDGEDDKNDGDNGDSGGGGGGEIMRLSSYVQSIVIHCRQPSASLNLYLLIFQAPLGPYSCCCLVRCYVSCH